MAVTLQNTFRHHTVVLARDKHIEASFLGGTKIRFMVSNERYSKVMTIGQENPKI